MQVEEIMLRSMRERVVGRDARWAAYRNLALDSMTLGEFRFLAVGPEATYKEAPPSFPGADGWKYRFMGWVNLETGEVEE